MCRNFGAYQLAEVRRSSKRLSHFSLTIFADTMITSGPISEIDLRSSALMTKATTLQGSYSKSGPSIIRINLEYQSKREPFIYPIDTCYCYFVGRP
jgi:hypothetical protein